jgi:hypothetical protein
MIDWLKEELDRTIGWQFKANRGEVMATPQQENDAIHWLGTVKRLLDRSADK